MTAHITITAELQDRPIVSLRADNDHTDKRQSMRAFIAELWGILTGRRAMVRSCIASACASATATLVAASISADDTITIAGVALTAKVAGNGTTQWTIGATDTISATNLAALINANTSTQKVVRASSALGVVTITCVFPGPVGNEVRLTKSSSGITVTGAGFLASGASDEVDQYQMGFTPAA